MKKISFAFFLLLIAVSAKAQTSEGNSGEIRLNISKKTTEQRKFADESKTPADIVPPVLKLQSPVIPGDSVVKADSRTLVVKGKVSDTGGIFAVMVNGIEAKVATDGEFLAEIPQAIGRNTIRIVATDIAMNNTKLQFYSERPAAVIPEQAAVQQSVQQPEKPVFTYKISISNPASDQAVTPADKFPLKGCVKATGPIKKIMIYRDGNFVNGYMGNKIVQKGDCSFEIEETIPLKLGINEIMIEVYSDQDTVSKSFTIEYSFYAARNFAVLIGNEKYDDPGINELDEPVKDAGDLYNLLIKDYNFDPSNVTLLKNPTKAEIIGTLHQLRSKITPDDNLLIFYAGHGYWDEGMGVGYWFPRDAAKNNPVNWLPNTDLTNYLGAIKAKHTLLIADACFSGGIFKTRSAFNASYAVEMLYQQPSRKAITSGYLKEVPDKSIFFQFLIKNLKENSSDYLSSEELFSKMRMAVINNSDNIPQFGTIQNVGDEGGDYIFIKRKK